MHPKQRWASWAGVSDGMKKGEKKLSPSILLAQRPDCGCRVPHCCRLRPFNSKPDLFVRDLVPARRKVTNTASNNV